MDRRGFLKTCAAIGGTLACGRARPAEVTDAKEFVGVLVDTTRCIGCRACEVACGRANGMAVPDVENDGALERERTTTDKQWTVVNRYQTDKGAVFVKRQCLHCWQPACAAACLTNAMHKTKAGPVIWHADKCMGCRYCMVSCPFNMPKFEYDEWNPDIQKCTMCYDRLQEGKRPACVDACPTDALMFGQKRELMEVARVRVYSHPTRYVRHVYGEHEVGGTGWLYLASVPFDQLGFRTDLGNTPYPEYTRGFLSAVPVVFFGVPAALVGLTLLANRSGAEEDNEI
ncbi:MAG TPA: 4Fe-4S dicluster domain-containing protein [Nitrospirota bacterium]|nr:4Fe-4S dicluster domain-containing protein [Nitrospirota bacterium]